jgi:recombinational DNA repair protein (RecF pathway)
MVAQTQTLTAFLLRQTLLPNDDVILELLTSDDQKISVFAHKLANSKKRRAEIDFFRLMDVVVQQTKNSWRLKSVSTQRVFGSCQQSYKVSTTCFDWLKELYLVLPSEKNSPGVFQLLLDLVGYVSVDTLVSADAFFQGQILRKLGMFPSLNLEPDTQWFDPLHFQLIDQPNNESLEMSLLLRKYLLFVSKCSFEQLTEKQKKLDASMLEKAAAFCQVMLRYTKD